MHDDKRNNFAPLKIGVFFGGASPARELSFATGRNIYDSLDKALFIPVPVFVDSLGNFILLQWPYLYKESIRDFYPPAPAIPNSVHQFPIYLESLGDLTPAHQEEIMRQVGLPLQPQEFQQHFSFAILALPGSAGEARELPGLLAENQIPFFGADTNISRPGSNILNQLRERSGLAFTLPPSRIITATDWANESRRTAIYEELKQATGLPLLLTNSEQGSGSGETVVFEDNFAAFAAAVDRAFYSRTINKSEWEGLDLPAQIETVLELSDIRKGIGLPLHTENGSIIHHPEQLLTILQRIFTQTNRQSLTLTRVEREPATITAEALVEGEGFVCTVLQDLNGLPIALHPVHRVNKEAGFNGAELLPAAAHEVKKLNLTPAQLQQIRQIGEQVASALGLKVWAQIQGVLTPSGEISLQAYSTNLASLPFNFICGQVAQIGLNPTQFLTYLIRTALTQSGQTDKNGTHLHTTGQALEAAIRNQTAARHQKTKVAVLIGGAGDHQAKFFNGGFYVFELLAASAKYQPMPVFLSGSVAHPKMYILPYYMLWVGNASAITAELSASANHPVPSSLSEVLDAAETLTTTYAGTMLREPLPVTYEQLRNLTDIIFMQCPTDGTLQAELEKHHLPYTGSRASVWQTYTDKTKTTNLLHQHGLHFTHSFTITQNVPENADYLKVTASLTTRYLPDGRLGYEVFVSPIAGLAGVGEPGEVKILTGESQLPVPGEETEVFQENEQLSLDKIKADFVKVAQALNIEGYAFIEALVRCNQNSKILAQITQIDLLPELTLRSPIFTQAISSGYKPYNVLDRLLQFSLERHKIQAH